MPASRSRTHEWKRLLQQIAERGGAIEIAIAHPERDGAEPDGHAAGPDLVWRVRIIELGDVRGSFCGFTEPSVDATFRSETERLLHYQRTPFCMMEGSDNAPLFSQCCHPRKPGDKFFPFVHGFDPPDALPRCEGGGGVFG